MWDQSRADNTTDCMNDEKAEARCDMMGSDLCRHYQDEHVCNYGGTHGVKICPIGHRTLASKVKKNEKV